MTDQSRLAALEEDFRFLAQDYHDREFWHDSNRTHTKKFEDCTDADCARYRESLPSLVCPDPADHALAEAVRRLLDGDWSIRHYMVIRPPGDGPYEHEYVVEVPVPCAWDEQPEAPSVGTGPTLEAAITAALTSGSAEPEGDKATTDCSDHHVGGMLGFCINCGMGDRVLEPKP